MRCSNCSGSHAADDKSCSVYLREVRLQKFRSSHHLPFGEARRRFSEFEKEESRSFASVAATSPPQHLPALNLASKSDLETMFHGISHTLSNYFNELRLTIENQFSLLCTSLTRTFEDLARSFLIPTIASDPPPPHPPPSPGAATYCETEQSSLNQPPGCSFSTDSSSSVSAQDCKKFKVTHDWSAIPASHPQFSVSTVDTLQCLQATLEASFREWDRKLPEMQAKMKEQIHAAIFSSSADSRQ